MEMSFVAMRDLLNNHFEEMTKDTEFLYTVQLDKDEMYNLYLDSFPSGTNEIYRTRREHDCSCCRGFIKNIGNVVKIKNGKIETVWDFETRDTTYAPVLKALSGFVKKHAIVDVYLSIEKKIGCHHNFEMIETFGSKQWDHFFLELEDKYVIRNSLSKGEVLNKYRTAKEVFQRGLEELALEAIDIVLDLVATNSLYRGEECKNALSKFRTHKIAYDKLTTAEEKNLYAWEHSVKLHESVSKIRNTAIGTLLVDLSEGKTLDDAVRAYESITAPSTYKRSKPLFTQKMLDDAQKKIESLGYAPALPRRHATLDDITVNDILFCNKDAAPRISGTANIFDDLAKIAKGKADNKFSRVEEISAEKFVNDVLPTVSSVEVYVENKHASNFVSLIAPVNSGVKSMFQWGNNFTWAYAGNVTDSMKEKVKAMGGKVDGDLRFSIQWNEDGSDNYDLDAHCIEPSGFDAGYNTARKPSYSPTNGQLDIDIIDPSGKVAVENITWASRRTMKPGEYKFYVHQFSGGVKHGFRAEIEFDGVIYSFDYPHVMRSGEKIVVATVILDKNGQFTIKPSLDSKGCTKNIWNINTNEFVPVTVICHSPNHWSTAETNVGHKHLFFMLKDCINEENPSGIFNEFLVRELYEHRHVMEAIGNRMRVESTSDQLSGLGFALDKREELVVKVVGTTERILKVKF